MKQISSLAIAILLMAGHPFAFSHEGHGHSPGVQSLDVYADDGKLHLLSGEISSGGKEPVLSYQTSADSGETWSHPVRVDTGAPPAHGLMRGMDARIAASGAHLVAVWETAGTDAWGGGPMATALSSDGGKTWTPGPKPADDGLTTGHGFIAIAADPSGVFHLIWLDNRTGKQGLRYARSTDGGLHWSANVTLDPETCECCWNTLAIGKDGTLCALYRAKKPRDMALAVSSDGGKTWEKRESAVGSFGWDFQGCPHVGGGIVNAGSNSRSLHAIVWTGLTGKSGLYTLASTDLGKTWSAPRLIKNPGAHHPDIAALPNGQLAVAWDNLSDNAVFGKTSADGGLTWSSTRRLSSPGIHAGYPRVLGTPGGFRVFWTETPPGQTVSWKMGKLSPN